MAAPDKIYLQELSDGTWDDCFVYESSETDTKGMKRVPYIRKDALLEWAKERKRYYEDEILRWGLSDSSQATTFVSIASIKRLVYEVVIDKLNEM